MVFKSFESEVEISNKNVENLLLNKEKIIENKKTTIVSNNINLSK